MPLEWLNHYVYQSGQWTGGQVMHLDSSNEVTFSAPGGRDLRIHETSRSGSVLLSPQGGALLGYGDAELYLTLLFADTNKPSEYRSAPLANPIRVDGVRTLRLSLLIPIGNPGCTAVQYMAIVNGHCVYERL
jgi:hypothetical protein